MAEILETSVIDAEINKYILLIQKRTIADTTIAVPVSV